MTNEREQQLEVHRWWSTQQRRRHQRVKKTPLQKQSHPYYDVYLHRLDAIEGVLADVFGDHLIYAEQFAAAYTLLPLHKSILPAPGKDYGQRKLREILDGLRYSLKYLTIKHEPPKHKLFSLPLGVHEEVETHLEYAETPELARYLSLLVRKYERQQSDIRFSGKYRAKETAYRLRAIFEHYSTYPIERFCERGRNLEGPIKVYGVTSGSTPTEHRGVVKSDPVGLFCRTLQRVFEVCEIEAKIVAVADAARLTSPDDDVISEARRQLKLNSGPSSSFPIFLSEFGWVKNSTYEGQQSELYEELYSYEELKRCHEKSSTTNGSTTIQIKNWISSQQK